MIQPDKKIQEERIVHYYNDAEPIEGCTKFYATIWYTDGSCLFYSYIYATDRAEAFIKAMQYLTERKSLNYVQSLSVTEAQW